MIKLEAATVLLQWAVGGMAFCWFTTRRRQVGLGYGWLLRSIYALMGAGAVACGLAFGTVPVREAAGIGFVIACHVALGVSIARKGAGVSGQRAEHDRRSARVAAMTRIDRPGPAQPDVAVEPAATGAEFPPVLDLVAVCIGYADHVLYPWYASAPRIWGITPMQDQMIGALIMWIPGGLFFFAIISVVFFRWQLRDGDETRAGAQVTR